MVRASDQIRAYLNGRQPNPSTAIFSAAALPIHKKSIAILRMEKSKRLKEIEKSPSYIQQRLKDEMIRLTATKNRSIVHTWPAIKRVCKQGTRS